MSSPQDPSALYETTPELISEHAFKIVLWVGIGAGIIICTLRFAIRIICFRRFLFEDYLMLFSLAILISTGAVLQRFLSDIYLMIHVQNRLAVPGPDFPDRMLAGLRASGAVLILNTVGIWLIKLNFLVFFYRLGHQVRSYLIFWWVAVVIVVGCGAVLLGVIPYSCSFGNFSHLTYQCSTVPSVNHIYTMYKVSISLDALSDAIIICFPVVIVWKTKIELGQKLILTGIFLLVAFNIAVTIVRGSIFGGTFTSVRDINRNVIDNSWMLFWYYLEYIVSLIIATIISFRSLWVGRKEKAKAKKMDHQNRDNIVMGQDGRVEQTKRTPPERQSTWHRFQNGLLDTLYSLEGTTLDQEDSSFLRLRLPDSRMNIDFSTWDGSPFISTHGSEELPIKTHESQTSR